MKLTKTITLLAFVSCIVLLIAGTAGAGIFDPGYRGDDNSVHAVFSWAGYPGEPWFTEIFETGDSIYPLYPMPPVAFDDGLTTTIILPNFIDELPEKLMRIQLYFDGPVLAEDIFIDVFALDPMPVLWDIVGGSAGISNAHFFDIEIHPNPDFEEILIFGNPLGNVVPGNLLMIEIDTVSVPEPATLLLLGLGGLVLRKKRN